MGRTASVPSDDSWSTTTHTYWRFETPAAPDKVLAEARAQLEAGGWRKEAMSLDREKGAFLWMFKGAAVLILFPLETQGATMAEKPRTAYCAHYLEGMTPNERKKAMEQVLAPDAAAVDPGIVLLFQAVWHCVEPDRVLDFLEKHPPRTDRGLLALARYHHELHRDEKARDALIRANAYVRAERAPDSLLPQVRDLAEKLGLSRPGRLPCPPELLRKLGFHEITPPGRSECEVALDETARFFWLNPDGIPDTFLAWVSRRKLPGERSTYAFSGVGTDGATCMTQTVWKNDPAKSDRGPGDDSLAISMGLPAARPPETVSVAASAQKTPRKERFRIRVVVTDMKKPHRTAPDGQVR